VLQRARDVCALAQIAGPSGQVASEPGVHLRDALCVAELFVERQRLLNRHNPAFVVEPTDVQDVAQPLKQPRSFLLWRALLLQ
jgi:hypothetical protein